MTRPRETDERSVKVEQPETIDVMWLLHGSPMPEGWRYAAHDPSHHSRYSNLIEKIPE